MKKQTENEKQINYITRKIVNLFKNCKLQEETKLVAICENENPECYELVELTNDMKTVTLGESFDEL